MTELRYPVSGLIWDYVRGLTGMAVALAILAVNPWDNLLMWLFVGLTILFAIYTMVTLKKQISRVRISDRGIEVGWRKMRGVSWDELKDVSLRFYPTSRNRKRGWMTLALKSDANRIEIDSSLPGFHALAMRARHEARTRGIALDRVTADNLAALATQAPENS